MSHRKILCINNLSKSFGSKQIINGISYDFFTNHLYGIIGESGNGKTTLLNILGLIDSEYEGNIVFDGNLLRNNKDYYELRAKKIGFVFQSYYLIDELTVKENILLPLKYSHKKINEDYFTDLITKLGLEKIIDDRTNYLSGGEKQRVAIARALINDPCLIICDEPTGNLDGKNSDSVMNILKSFLSENRCIILVTHSESVSIQCTKLIRLEGGKLYEVSD